MKFSTDRTIMPPAIASPGNGKTHESGSMKLRPTFIESSAVAGFFILGVWLRTALLEREAVEHFDEGIYASVLWYDGQFNEPYPARHLYAPPLISALIEFVSWIPGLARCAPFLPSVFFGIATILAIWWLARSWFGKPAGLFIAAVVSMSDFHILYSRMALTDVACLFWIVASVGLGTRAVSQSCVRTAVAAGFVCGLAWWTKYTGWLPLAILCSGCGLWWMWPGRNVITLRRFTGILGTIVVVALATFAPWWWQLRDVGGYQAVATTHASYVTGWSFWTKNLAQQLSDQFLFDGFTGQLSLGLGLGLAGLVRWTAGRSTWNAAPGRLDSTAAITLPPLSLMFRFTAAAIALSVISVRIKTPLMLICIAVGGLSGMYLWPVLRRAWQRRELHDLSPTSPEALPLTATDLECALTIDPAAGVLHDTDMVCRHVDFHADVFALQPAVSTPACCHLAGGGRRRRVVAGIESQCRATDRGNRRDSSETHLGTTAGVNDAGGGVRLIFLSIR
ncbi:MAG: glycosyltransferase family 39 protein [Planctomycetaceae bacterium]